MNAELNSINPDTIASAARSAAIALVLSEEALEDGKTPPPSAAALIEGLHLIVCWYREGAPIEQRAIKAIDLAETLFNDYADFGATYLDTVGTEHKDSITLKAERLLRSGAVTPQTTFAELPEILAADAAKGDAA